MICLGLPNTLNRFRLVYCNAKFYPVNQMKSKNIKIHLKIKSIQIQVQLTFSLFTSLVWLIPDPALSLVT